MPAPDPIDINAVFGRLTVLRADSARGSKYYWCRCACGNEKSVRRDHLLKGRVRSCGCLNSELTRARVVNLQRANTKHGKCKTRAYNVWSSMRERCSNPNHNAYHRYGKRGIVVCERWSKFENFLADMGDPPISYTLERIDNDGPYSPDNCKWATRMEQGNNREINRRITLDGVTHTVAEWSRISGISYKTLSNRVNTMNLLPKDLLSKGKLPSGSTLTPDQVREIRATPDATLYALGKKYGVSAGNIHHIRNRKSWKNLPD